MMEGLMYKDSESAGELVRMKIHRRIKK